MDEGVRVAIGADELLDEERIASGPFQNQRREGLGRAPTESVLDEIPDRFLSERADLHVVRMRRDVAQGLRRLGPADQVQHQTVIGAQECQLLGQLDR